MTLGAVKIAPLASPSNELGINQSNGSNLLGKNAIIVASDHQRSGESRFIQSMNVAEASVKTYNTKSIKHERGRGLRHNS
jgi:fatty acid/phospholipid biosynthesis enzyme